MDQTMAQTEKLLTGEDLLAMGDMEPCELIDGRIMSMIPTGGEHGRIEFYLGAELTQFVRNQHIGWVLGGEVGIYTQRNPDTVRGADVVVLSKERAPDGPAKGFLEVAPEVVVEVMSPTNRWEMMRRKIEEYFSIGVAQVWVIEPDNRVILIYKSAIDVQKFIEGELLHGEGILEGFTLDVTELFAP